MNKHATVKIGEFEVPLIGIPEFATLEECDDCGDQFGLQEMTIVLKPRGMRHLRIVCKQCVKGYE